jgi:hypothetical protein
MNLKKLTTLTLSTLVGISALQGDEAEWKIESEGDWKEKIETSKGAVFNKGSVSPKEKMATILTKLQSFDTKRSANSLNVTQSPVWQNWDPIENLGPVNLQDAPVLLTMGPDNYWMFGRYGRGARRNRGAEVASPHTPTKATLDGFDLPLLTTRFSNQYDAPGGLKPRS